jgi:uncharacterized protein YlxW (UPF0749 family)
MRRIAERILVPGLLCCLLGGCFAERRQEIREKAADLQTRVAVLQQRVDAQERRLEKLEGEVAELSKRR